MMHAPIVLFVYNRPKHTQDCLLSLAAAHDATLSPLIIFSDAPKNESQCSTVDAVRAICRSASGFASVELIEREENQGLAKNIIEGVSAVIQKHGRVIVLEDDLCVSPLFIRYMNEALDFYESSRAFSIAGYSPQIELPDDYPYTTYAMMRNCSWSWATWLDRWQKINWLTTDFDSFIRDKQRILTFNQAGNDLSPMLLRQVTGEINSWSIRFCYNAFRLAMPTIYPTRSFVTNNGVDGSGTHMKASSKYQTVTADSLDPSSFTPSLEIQKDIQSHFASFYNTSFVRRVINTVKRWKYISNKTNFARKGK